MQRVKYNNNYSEWGSVLGGISQGSALGSLLFLVYVNDMPLQVGNGALVQFADDTCIICSGGTHKEVSEMLCDELCSISSWIRSSHMEVNIKKSNIMCLMFISLSILSHLLSLKFLFCYLYNNRELIK